MPGSGSKAGGGALSIGFPTKGAWREQLGYGVFALSVRML
jgi:hypothetical protein